MVISHFLERQTVNGHVSVHSKRQALQILSDMAERSYGLDSGLVFNALCEREKLGSTGVGQGVGVPHAALKGLDRMRGLFIRLDQPIDYDSVDDLPVDLVFALLAPEEAGTEHLRALARVSRALRQPELRQQLRTIDNNDALFALLTRSTQSNAA